MTTNRSDAMLAKTVDLMPILGIGPKGALASGAVPFLLAARTWRTDSIGWPSEALLDAGLSASLPDFASNPHAAEHRICDLEDLLASLDSQMRQERLRRLGLS